MKKLLAHFVRGFLFLGPIAFSVWLVYELFTTIDGWLGAPIPGIGFVGVIFLVTAVGYLVQNVVTRGILLAIDSTLDRLPFVKLLHTSVKDLMNAFVGEKRRFDKPAMVELIPGSGVQVLGFVTREHLEPIAGAGHVAVYLPQSYNFAGQLVLVPRERVVPLAIDSTHLMTFIVSGAVTGT